MVIHLGFNGMRMIECLLMGPSWLWKNDMVSWLFIWFNGDIITRKMEMTHRYRTKYEVYGDINQQKYGCHE